MSDSDVIITQCGVGVPEALMSTSNSIRLEFNSDSNVERGGFQLQYTIARPAGEETASQSEHDMYIDLPKKQSTCQLTASQITLTDVKLLPYLTAMYKIIFVKQF